MQILTDDDGYDQRCPRCGQPIYQTVFTSLPPQYGFSCECVGFDPGKSWSDAWLNYICAREHNANKRSI